MNGIKFFIYGSMTEGFVHFSKIKDFIESSQPALIYATAYRLKVGFPVLLDEGNYSVPGDLVHLKTLTTSDLLVALLDEFHGVNSLDSGKGLYFRKEVEVKCDSTTERAWCYFLNSDKLPPQSEKIENGDWKTLIFLQPPIVSSLTERQRNYIQKLGSSSGREIVPIDLTLYRELMKLELIVDKGRRLALSKLGQQVYRYL